MDRFAFVSRHEPTDSQRMLAAKASIELVMVGDRDGFTLNSDEFKEFQGVVVVHAQAAMRALISGLKVGVFNNANRAPLGEKPRFETTSLVVSKTEKLGFGFDLIEDKYEETYWARFHTDKLVPDVNTFLGAEKRQDAVEMIDLYCKRYDLGLSYDLELR